MNLSADATQSSVLTCDRTRAQVRASVVSALNRRKVPWAWQGPTGAPAAWDTARGPADLDIWWDPTEAQKSAVLADLWQAFSYAVVAESTDPRRLRHQSLAVEVDGELAIVDFTEADLRVGAILLVPAEEVEVSEPGTGYPVLAGVAGAADLLLRPLLRGKIPPEPRIAEARSRWAQARSDQRAAALARWRLDLGPEADSVARVLEGAAPDAGLAQRVRRRLLRRTIAPSGLRAAWAQRWSVAPAGRSAGPIGARTRGVVVALVGTDGSGKSTVARQLAERLEVLGYPTSEAYFGMARGNLPGVGLARKLLGIATEPERSGAGEAPATEDRPPAAPAVGTKELEHPRVRQVAAWFYAGEYVWRYLRHVAPGVRRRTVVICDRYVYDLRDSPWPGSPAARFVERVVPAPDILVLPDAPAAQIHARKPERSLAEQAAAQKAFRVLLAEGPACCSELIVDTSGNDPDPVAPVVVAVVQASHRPRSSPRA